MNEYGIAVILIRNENKALFVFVISDRPRRNPHGVGAETRVMIVCLSHETSDSGVSVTMTFRSKSKNLINITALTFTTRKEPAVHLKPQGYLGFLPRSMKRLWQKLHPLFTDLSYGFFFIPE